MTANMANFLAMPSPLRLLLLQAMASPPSRRRAFSTIHQHLASPSPSTRSSTPRPSAQPALSFLPSPSNDPQQRANPAPAPADAALAAATALLTDPRPRFLYSAPRFLHLPVNTLVPEVCLLGRSNVGKSTLINALAGVESAAAGRSHGRAATRAGLAVTSTRAGSTTTMNAYGCGPPVEVTRAAAGQAAEDSNDKKGGGGGGGGSRRDRRAGRKRREPSPAYSLVLMDMPGYGLNSRAEWGAEIQKYLGRRAALRGAVVLLDAVAGIKEGDRMILGMLRDAGVRTAVVLTKADKLLGQPRGVVVEGVEGQGQGQGRGEHAVRDACLRIWGELRALEQRHLSWTEGNGWEREIWVTSAGDPKNGGLGVEGARLAICRMAGLVEDDRKLEQPRASSQGSGPIISFDQLELLQRPVGHAAQRSFDPRATL